MDFVLVELGFKTLVTTVPSGCIKRFQIKDRAKQMRIWDHKGIICNTYQLLKCFQILKICIFQGHMTTKYKSALISKTVRERVKRTEIWDHMHCE